MRLAAIVALFLCACTPPEPAMSPPAERVASEPDSRRPLAPGGDAWTPEPPAPLEIRARQCRPQRRSVLANAGLVVGRVTDQHEAALFWEMVVVRRDTGHAVPVQLGRGGRFSAQLAVGRWEARVGGRAGLFIGAFHVGLGEAEVNLVVPTRVVEGQATVDGEAAQQGQHAVVFEHASGFEIVAGWRAEGRFEVALPDGPGWRVALRTTDPQGPVLGEADLGPVGEGAQALELAAESVPVTVEVTVAGEPMPDDGLIDGRGRAQVRLGRGRGGPWVVPLGERGPAARVVRLLPNPAYRVQIVPGLPSAQDAVPGSAPVVVCSADAPCALGDGPLALDWPGQPMERTVRGADRRRRRAAAEHAPVRSVGVRGVC